MPTKHEQPARGTRQRLAMVGAGVGGLAAAARLAHAGFDVQVYEKSDGPGGRCGKLEVDGFTFDTGPTLLLMPEVLEETFRVVGRDMKDYVELVRCDPNYRIHFRDDSQVTFSTDLVDMSRELESIEPGSFSKYLSFLAVGQNQYQTSLDRFVGRNFDSLLDFLTPGNIKKVFEIKAHKFMYSEVSNYFQDPRLRAAMTFQTMYLGISPYESPAVYGLLPYTELAVGIWFPKGGMHAIPVALEKLCRDLGVTFHYGKSVQRIVIEGGQAKGLLLEGGELVAADAVVCNADLPWAYRNLIDPKETALKGAAEMKYTSSAFMLYLGTTKRFPGLLHHNVFFGGDYKASFDDIFKKFKVPDDPSFYVNVPNRTDGSLAPEGGDSVYILVPVPHRHATVDWAVEGPKVRAKVFKRLAELGVADLEQHIAVERHWTPDDYEFKLNLERGSAFGLSHNFFQVGPFRPTNQDRKVNNLFFVGASTQPGTGLPMVMLSARLVAERVHHWAAKAVKQPVAAAAPVEATA
jgi:phytoene desaturase